ncbi:AP-1 complex subunit gamma, putative [Plasmodium malariae]|uniref:AP-1 complex subunit gamma, putative n=3 Tax=Plasmodium (Plasmodium) TaxID=418103 RepID=A0A1D3SQ36_PLAMA|nr:AP-1 complex subunit gamma, putative [Plasmodium malariae]SCO94017.1 AP-1 complex subunit gamma, putative [Plasmodium malariae]
MSVKLRELIRSIRNCKTAAEERSVVAKECALIRTAFKEEDNIYRHRNVAKLLFINMLGYPTYFGQIECLKLIASNKFTFKRIGYLGLTILLDENTDILMLVTNSIKNDLRNSNQYINGLALCALGNIANSEMCSSLRHEIVEMMNINNPYIKKKAVMCAIRILKKTNDIEELFIEKISNLLDDRNHGVLSAGVTLMLTLIEKNPQYKHILRVYTSKIVKILKSCVMSGYSHGAEYDIYGINDPFLQVKILKLLKYLNCEGTGRSGNSNKQNRGSINNRNDECDKNQSSKNFTSDEFMTRQDVHAHTEGKVTNMEGTYHDVNSNINNNSNISDSYNSNRNNNISNNNISNNNNSNVSNSNVSNSNVSNSLYDMDEVNSVLAQVATNTDSLKNVGNAILYECVKTITYISSDPGLLVLAVNVLGKFLQNNDNNIRYVGLCTLQKLLKKDPKTLHIYRNTIIECLKDQDISIRKKALDVAFALITKDSLKVMIKELLNYLLVADMEIKSDIVSNICVAVNKYAPNVQYLLDTYIKLFCLAGNFIQDHIKDDFIYYLLQNPEFHSYVVFKIFFSIKENIDQYALIQVGIWCIGELGDILIQEKNIGPDEEVITVTHDDVFNLLEKIVKTYERNGIKELHNINIKDPIHNIIYNKSLNILEDNSNIGNNSNSNSNRNRSNNSNSNIHSSNNNIRISSCGGSANTNAFICCNINENANNDDNNIIMQYILMCLNKLTVRFPTQKNKIEKIIQRYKKNKCIEIQQRACEFHAFMNPQWDDIREDILLRIPPCTKKVNRRKNTNQEDVDPLYNDTVIDSSNKQNAPTDVPNDAQSNNSAYVDLLDLDDVLGIQSTVSKNDDPNNFRSTNCISNINNFSSSREHTTFLMKDNNIDMNKTSNPDSNLNINDSHFNKVDTLNISDTFKINNSPTKDNPTIDNIVSCDSIQKIENNSELVHKKNEDILADLFGSISIDQPKDNMQNGSSQNGNNSVNLLDDIQTVEHGDILNLNLIDDKSEKKKVLIQPMKIYDKNNIEMSFHFEKEDLDSENTIIKATYSNKSSSLISSFIFEAVVPNYVKMEILAASSRELLPFKENIIKQDLKIVNKLFKKKPVLMKVRISYTKNNENFQDFINIGNFPDAL